MSYLTQVLTATIIFGSVSALGIAAALGLMDKKSALSGDTTAHSTDE